MKILIIKNGNCETDITKFLKEINKDIEILSKNSKTIDYNELIIEDLDGIIILGGPQRLSNSETLNDHPYLINLISHLKIWIEKDIKILGICLGAQLIALATGHKVRECDKLITGYQNIQITDEGKLDKLFGCEFDIFKNLYLSLHYDRIDISQSGSKFRILAKYNDIVYGFRYKNTYGVQFHPDITLRILMLFCSEFNFDSRLVEEGSRISDDSKIASLVFFDNWIRI